MFDINWSRKIKITINGKEYARLEDVPEEFRVLLKDSDGDGIPDVARQGKRTWRVAGFVSLGGASDTECVTDKICHFSGFSQLGSLWPRPNTAGAPNGAERGRMSGP